MLTHHNIVNNGQFLAQGFHYTEQDRICVPVPLFHCYGCVIGTMTALNTGAALIFPNSTFDARATLQAIHAEHATSVYGVPAMYVAELSLPDFAGYDLTSLRTGMMSGAPCPIELMKRVLTEMHIGELVIAYGQTESSPVVTMSDAEDPLEIRVNTVGRAMPQTEIKIVSMSDNATLPVGQQGEVCARGYVVMKGYDAEPEATALAIDRDGWLHTGDLGVMHDDGCIHLTGRSRDIIIRGGENIYPREIEEFLYTHPKISEVQVVGIPSARLGEVVCAWVRLRPGSSATEEEIREWCRDQIAYFKIPEHIRFVDEFPATLSGKIQKYKIREFEIEARGLQSASAATARAGRTSDPSQPDAWRALTLAQYRNPSRCGNSSSSSSASISSRCSCMRRRCIARNTTCAAEEDRRRPRHVGPRRLDPWLRRHREQHHRRKKPQIRNQQQRKIRRRVRLRSGKRNRLHVQEKHIRQHHAPPHRHDNLRARHSVPIQRSVQAARDRRRQAQCRAPQQHPSPRRAHLRHSRLAHRHAKDPPPALIRRRQKRAPQSRDTVQNATIGTTARKPSGENTNAIRPAAVLTRITVANTSAAPMPPAITSTMR